jgi:hypothetical protein
VSVQKPPPPGAAQHHRRYCVCKRNLDSGPAPGGLRLPVDEAQIEAARATVADNKGAQWAAAQELALLAGDGA